MLQTKGLHAIVCSIQPVYEIDASHTRKEELQEPERCRQRLDQTLKIRDVVSGMFFKDTNGDLDASRTAKRYSIE